MSGTWGDWQDRAIPPRKNPYEYLADRLIDKLEFWTDESNRAMWEADGHTELDMHRALWRALLDDIKVVCVTKHDSLQQKPSWFDRFMDLMKAGFVTWK